MDSLSLYKSICESACDVSGEIKLENVDKIVKAIVSEIMDGPCDLDKSPFLVEANKLLGSSDREANPSVLLRISVLDAKVIINVLKDYIQDNSLKAVEKGENRCVAAHIFKHDNFGKDNQNIMNALRDGLTAVGQMAENMRKDSEKAPSRPERESHAGESAARGGGVSGGLGNFPKAGAALAINGDKSDEVKKLRMENNQKNVRQWHEETTGISRKLLEIQADASELLKKVMSFSDEITENYVLQFAKMQIDLFNLIADNYDYHKKASKDGGSQDYKNAVSNYQDFLDMIMDNLSAFGIEEIRSDDGTDFDGRIHKVEGSDNFSPRTSKVKKSVRSGFQYKELVIQKEKITV